MPMKVPGSDQKGKNMFARVSTFQETAGSIDDSVGRTSEVIAKAESLSGFKGLYYLINRSSGQSVAITLWDSEAAMQQSEEAANQLRNDEAAATGGEILSVERYEVAAAELR